MLTVIGSGINLARLRKQKKKAKKKKKKENKKEKNNTHEYGEWE